MRRTPIELTVRRTVPATPEETYDRVTDITRMGELSPETDENAWVGDPGRAEVGARFRGVNRLRWLRWSTEAEVVAAERGRRFAFSTPGRTGTDWTYTFAPAPEGTLVVEHMRQHAPTILPIRVLQRLAGVTDRAEVLRAGMTTTLDNLADALAHAPATR